MRKSNATSTGRHDKRPTRATTGITSAESDALYRLAREPGGLPPAELPIFVRVGLGLKQLAMVGPDGRVRITFAGTAALGRFGHPSRVQAVPTPLAHPH